MEPQQAIAIARRYVKQVYSEEAISNLGLEEVEFLPKENVWKIGISFSREKEIIRTRGQELADLLAARTSASPSSTKIVLEQLYKVVTISNDGDVLSMKNMTIAESV